MDENENFYDESQENVVDSQEDVDEYDDYESEPDETEGYEEEAETSQEVAEPEREQTPEENTAFKKMRLKAKEEALREIEAEKQAIETEKQELNRLRQEKLAFDAKQRIMNNVLTRENIENKAYAEGITEDVAVKLLEYEANAIFEAEKNKISQRFNDINMQKEELKKDKYFKLLEKDVDAIVNSNPNVDFKTVYFYQKGMREQELNKQLVSNTEKRTIANIQDRSRRRSLGNSDGGDESRVNPSKVLDKDTQEMTLAFGNDPRKIAKYVVKNTMKKKG